MDKRKKLQNNIAKEHFKDLKRHHDDITWGLEHERIMFDAHHRKKKSKFTGIQWDDEWRKWVKKKRPDLYKKYMKDSENDPKRGQGIFAQMMNAPDPKPALKSDFSMEVFSDLVNQMTEPPADYCLWVGSEKAKRELLDIGVPEEKIKMISNEPL